MISLCSNLGEPQACLVTWQIPFRARQVEMGPKLANQDIHIQTFPYIGPWAISFKISPHKYFMKAFEHRCSFWWSQCKVNCCVTSFGHFGLPAVKQNFLFSLYKVGGGRFSITTQMSERQRPQIYQLGGPIYHVKQWIYRLWHGEFKSLGTKTAFFYWSQDND